MDQMPPEPLTHLGGTFYLATDQWAAVVYRRLRSGVYEVEASFGCLGNALAYVLRRMTPKQRARAKDLQTLLRDHRAALIELRACKIRFEELARLQADGRIGS